VLINGQPVKSSTGSNLIPDYLTRDLSGSNTVSLHFRDFSILRFYIGYQQTCDLLNDPWMLLY
jgi:hypothetical protein